MSETLDYNSVAPEAIRSLHEAQKILAKSGLDEHLVVLAVLRASQLNGCAFCLALHMREGQALGESIDRLTGVAAWHDAPRYSERERVALEWTEALTLVAKERPASDLLARLKEHFSDREIVHLTMAINTINSWNRLNVAFETSPQRADEVFRMLHPQAEPAHA